VGRHNNGGDIRVVFGKVGQQGETVHLRHLHIGYHKWDHIIVQAGNGRFSIERSEGGKRISKIREFFLDQAQPDMIVVYNENLWYHRL